jgi:hypothetical protein
MAMLTGPAWAVVGALTLGVAVLDARALTLCRTRGDSVKVRDVCRARETPLDATAIGLWRTAPIQASLVQRELVQSTFDTTFAFSPQCDAAGGEVVTGGGCVCDTVGKIVETRQSSAGWFCVCDQRDTIIAYVTCTKPRIAVCGNGVAEPPGEDCDGPDVARCGPGSFACTSSCRCVPAEPTRCCSIASSTSSACFDAPAPDAAAECSSTLLGSLAPEGALCGSGRCGPERRPGAYCCQCPAVSPAFPHPTFCLDFAPGSEFDCAVLGCALSVGGQCSPATGSCVAP